MQSRPCFDEGRVLCQVLRKTSSSWYDDSDPGEQVRRESERVKVIPQLDPRSSPSDSPRSSPQRSRSEVRVPLNVGLNPKQAAVLDAGCWIVLRHLRITLPLHLHGRTEDSWSQSTFLTRIFLNSEVSAMPRRRSTSAFCVESSTEIF